MYSILEVDDITHNDWVITFLIQNGMTINNNVQDKINALYLLKSGNLLSPISIDDVFKLSTEFIKGIVQVNNYKENNDFEGRLYVLIILHNWGNLREEDNTYIRNKRFLNLFRYVFGQLYRITNKDINKLGDFNSILNNADILRKYVMTMPSGIISFLPINMATNNDTNVLPFHSEMMILLDEDVIGGIYNSTVKLLEGYDMGDSVRKEYNKLYSPPGIIQRNHFNKGYNWNDGFPYKRLDPKFGSIITMIRKLQILSSNMIIGKIPEKQVDFTVYRLNRLGSPSFIDNPLNLIDAGPEEYDLNKLTDYYTEYARVRARFGTFQSPYEYYLKNKNRLYGGVYNKREYIYRNTKEANQFKITTTMYIIDYFNCKKMLDFTAGWGDRLFGAVIKDIEYVGIDPNIELQPGHNENINTFGDPNKQIIHYNYAENFDFSTLDNDYDVCFTSPPFFDVEIYSNNINLETNFRLWLHNFLFDVITKSWSKIRLNGHLCLHIGDTKQNPIIEPTILYILSNLTNSQYIGYFGVKGRHIVGIYVFKKIEQSTPRDLELDMFRNTYPDLY